MNIKLPKRFFYTTAKQDRSAFVDYGVLYIRGYLNFEDLMYSLTYAYHGYSRCKYCGKVLSPYDCSLDHIYPRSWGGVSIPDNLLPCCKTCNLNKADMSPKQFNHWRNLITNEERKFYYKRCQRDNSKFIAKGNFILPGKWLSQYDISELVDDLDFSCLEPYKTEKVREYYEANHQFNHPIIVSSDNWLLKGKHILYQAKQVNASSVPAIVLDNVVVLRDTP